MIQRPNSVRLPVKPLREFFSRDLDRNSPIQSSIAGSIHRAHASRPNQAEDFVRPEFFACRECHGLIELSLAAALSAAALWAAKGELLLPVVILGGYFGGYATLVEAAALSVLYAVVLECAVYREIGMRGDLPRVAAECAAVTGGFLIVVGTALALTNYLVTAEVPVRILDFVQARIESPLVFLLVLNVFLIVVGALMDIYSAILVVVPLILPIGAAYGIDPVHLGIIFLANMELGYLMPPMGENLFLSSLAFNKPLPAVSRATIPFVVALLLTVLLITYVPTLTLGVTRAVFP